MHCAKTNRNPHLGPAALGCPVERQFDGNDVGRALLPAIEEHNRERHDFSRAD